MMSIKEIKALLDEGKIVVLYKDENGYAVTEFPPRTSKDGGKKSTISNKFDKLSIYHYNKEMEAKTLSEEIIKIKH